MYPPNHVPVTVPQGTSNRLQPSLAALRMPHYLPANIWLFKYAPHLSNN